MFGRCKHKWELVDKTILDSALQEIAKESSTFEVRSMSEALKRTVIFVFICSKCGEKKIEKITT